MIHCKICGRPSPGNIFSCSKRDITSAFSQASLYHDKYTFFIDDDRNAFLAEEKMVNGIVKTRVHNLQWKQKDEIENYRAILSPDNTQLLFSYDGNIKFELLTFSRSLAANYPLMKTHVKATGPHPKYPPRGNVAHISFDVEDQQYNPVNFTDQVVIANDRTKKDKGWADPATIELSELQNRFSYHGPIKIGPDALPRNPVGRTGMVGRGLLGKWGPNHAADSIVTRYNDNNELEVVLIVRKDTGESATPGGMVEPGENVSATAKREFTEETNNVKVKDPTYIEMVDKLFEKGVEVYSGYVDDPRNTDNSWMESTFFHFHCDKQTGETLKLKAGDDARFASWVKYDDVKKKDYNLYASHKGMVIKAIELMLSSEGPQFDSEPIRVVKTVTFDK